MDPGNSTRPPGAANAPIQASAESGWGGDRYDRAGGRDHPVMQRVLEDFRFSGDALLTDIATITPLLAARPSSEAGP